MTRNALRRKPFPGRFFFPARKNYYFFLPFVLFRVFRGQYTSLLLFSGSPSSRYNPNLPRKTNCSFQSGNIPHGPDLDHSENAAVLAYPVLGEKSVFAGIQAGQSPGRQDDPQKVIARPRDAAVKSKGLLRKALPLLSISSSDQT